ncbi:DUF488 family protein [Neptuniibacter sp. QD37_11]|uniref:DUF488 domain-containing protein n=1 Tax=Neptuniibacter sp. QD37_11 TaxID=3398209 RepID=UPI0039F5F559
MTKLFSIGYAGRSPKGLLSILSHFNVELLIDVRSNPYSKVNPEYNGVAFSRFLKEHGLKYADLGELLGARPESKSLYDRQSGAADYQRISQSAPFQKGINNLIAALNNGINAALICAERNPETCHRSLLIGDYLQTNFHIEMEHIISADKLLNQRELVHDLVYRDTSGNIDLFSDFEQLKSEALDRQIKKYAYVNPTYKQEKLKIQRNRR